MISLGNSRISRLVPVALGFLTLGPSACSLNHDSTTSRTCTIQSVESSGGNSIVSRDVIRVDDDKVRLTLRSKQCGTLLVTRDGLRNHDMVRALNELGEGSSHVFKLDGNIVKDFR